MRSRDGNEPVDYTCPLIDACKDAVEDLVQNVDCDTDFDSCTVEQLQNLHKAWVDFDWVIFETKIEEVRSANQALREWGNERDQAAETAEGDLDAANDKIAELEESVRHLEAVISDMENDLE